MNAIVACDSSWGIGYCGQLQKPISADLKRFKELTWGKVVIYGRLTMKTHPGGKPLPGRHNIVLTSDPDFTVEGAVVAHSVPEVLQYVKDLKQNENFTDDDFFITGGSSVYSQFMPYTNRVYVTQHHQSYPADCDFPDLDTDPNFKLSSVGEWQEEQGAYFRYLTYERKSIA